MLNVDVINTILPQLIQEDNRVFVALLPENDAVTVPTEEQIAAAIAEVEAEDIEPYRDEMKSEPLIPALPKAGSIKATSQLKDWDATEYTLSNGVKVIVKPTTFKENEIKLYAVAKGGTSTVDESKAATIKFLDYSLSQHGLGTYTALDLQKYLQGKQASVDLDLSSYSRAVTGSTTVKDLPTLMELLYMTFVDYNITEDEFAATQSSISGILANQESTPQYLFSKGALANLFKAASRQALSVADVNAADRQATLDIVHSMVANAADYTFVFVGNIDMDTFKPLMEQYIATLPANAKKATKSITNREDIEPILGACNIRETTAMETPQSWVFIGSIAKVPYTAENKAIISIASQILSNRLLKKVREEMGATYSIGASGTIDRLSNANTFIQIAFPMKPEMKDEVLPIIKDMVEDMAKTVTDEELNPIKEFMVKSAKESLEENGSWASAIASTSLNGVQTFTNQIDVVNSITVEKVQSLMATILSQGNYRVYVLDPAE
jgi:zinc protease